MKNKATIVFILFTLFFYDPIFSQEIEKDNYVIITFEMIRSSEPKAVNKFYWITSVESINTTDFYLFPLYLTQYSKNDLDGCLNGDTIDMFTLTTDTQYNFKEGYETNISQLTSLLDSRRTKVQTIKMKWNKGYKEDIDVYATPVIGKFCNCVQSHMVGAKVDFEGMIFIPLSDFIFDDDFWGKDKSKKVMFANYSSVDFRSYLLLYGRSVRTKFE